MKWLLKLYPPAWKQRYRCEVEAHLDSELPKLRTAFDLITGAIDAWLNPDSIPKMQKGRGEQTAISASRCRFDDICASDGLRSAVWALGLTFVLSAIGVVLDKRLGPSILIEALLYSAFFIAFTVSSRYTYLRSCSRTAQNVIIGLGVPGWYGFFLSVAALETMT